MMAPLPVPAAVQHGSVMGALVDRQVDCLDDGEAAVFECIADTLAHQSWCVVPDALPQALTAALFARIHELEDSAFAEAGVGRSTDHTINRFVRRDQISWIEGHGVAEQAWLTWTSRLQVYLNRRLFMGLFSLESHFAHYRAGDFYKKHVDAFRPDGTERGAQRVLSVVAYLNPSWLQSEGGDLLIYDEAGIDVVQRVLPTYGTLVVFLSTEVPHEVLPATRDRFSIAGWFRRNGSLSDRPDPPQ
jgi:SM-20-related protein